MSISVSGSPKSVSFLGKRRKEWSVYYEFQRNSFKHGISLDAADNRTFKKTTCYETVHCTVSPKFTSEFGATCLLCFAQFTPTRKRRKAPKMARTRCPCHFSNPSECNQLHPPPFAREAKRFIYYNIRRGLATLSKS